MNHITDRGFMAAVIEDSVTEHGVRLPTFQLRYPRFIHSELMTHRVFSRNASSSRAIPIAKMIEQVRSAPAMPIHWGKNQPGMQAREQLTGDALAATRRMWLEAAMEAASTAEIMMRYGAAKQVVNRILEPFQWMHTIVTATEWDNWFELRDHGDADPNIELLAQLMRKALAGSTPTLRRRDRLDEAAWHLPYCSPVDRITLPVDVLRKVSAARCARVSYLTLDGLEPDTEKDLALYDRLVGSRPLHASPVEHQAYPLPLASQWSKNFRGWRQHREIVEIEAFGG